MTDPIKWSGKTSSFHHKWHDTPNPEGVAKGFRKVWFLDAQWSDCPVEVEDQVKDLWRWAELGNDKYIFKTSVAELEHIHEEDNVTERWRDKWVEEKLETNAIVQYIKEQCPDIDSEDQILIHWWW